MLTTVNEKGEDCTTKVVENAQLSFLSSSKYKGEEVKDDKKVECTAISNYSKATYSATSVKKLSNMFGPEFAVINGLHQNKRVIASRSIISPVHDAMFTM